MKVLYAAVGAVLCAQGVLGRCPAEAKPVSPFDLREYLGVWYQIADTGAFNNRTEKGCECVYANYTLEDASTVRVENVCFRDGKKTVANGRAKQVVPNTGALKVSFFGPFFGPYNVINLKNDASGHYAISLVFSCADVLGFEEQDVWVLSRTREISDADYQLMVRYAEQHGISLARLGLIKTKQTGCAPVQL